MSGFIPGGAGQGILTVTMTDVTALYLAYMPFIERGGLFVRTKKQYQLGSEVFILLTLMDEPEQIPISGKVVWLTPAGAQGSRVSGIGVQFSAQETNLVQKIEKYLVGALDAERLTHTM